LLFLVATTSAGVAEAQLENTDGATQGGPTSGEEMVPPFDPRYFLGVWEIEWNPPEAGLFPPGPYTGTETVRHINNRYLSVKVNLQGEDGTTITGEGMMFYEFALGGQSVVRYVVYNTGFSLLQAGPVGGDLGGYYSAFWETPLVEHAGHTFVLRGRSFYVSPAAYRVNQEISVDGAEFFNHGVMWLTKQATAVGTP
jgi:hypothetical protein